LTKQEIRTLEGKLIKQFSEQLAVKTRLGTSAPELLHFPNLTQWLKVVGVSPETGEVIRSRVRNLEELKEKTECELQRVLLMAGHLPPALRREDLRRLCRALLNLRKYTDALVYGAKQYGPSQVVFSSNPTNMDPPRSFFIQSNQYGPSQVLCSSLPSSQD